MAKFDEIDDIDRRLLQVLQDDASQSIQHIGDTIGLSTNACWRRIKRLEECGVIEKRVVLLNPAKLGLATTVFVAVRTTRHDPKWLESFSAGIADIPEIVECHRMSGDVDYMLKVIVRDITHYDQVYQRLITSVPGLGDVSSAFSMERLKSSHAIAANTF